MLFSELNYSFEPRTNLKLMLNAFDIIIKHNGLCGVANYRGKTIPSSSTASKKTYLGTAAASFVGIMAAVPLTLALVGPDNKAGAVAGEDHDYAKFAYAYTQGYMANAGVDGVMATSGNGGSGAFVCADPDHEYNGGVGAVATSHSRPVGGFGNAPDRDWHHDRHNRDDRPRGGQGADAP